MKSKILFSSFLIYDDRRYILWGVAALLSPILIYNLYLSFTLLKFIVFSVILLVLLSYTIQFKVKIFSNNEVNIFYYFFGLEIYKSTRIPAFSKVYIFRRNSSSKSGVYRTGSGFTQSKGGMLQPNIHLQVFDEKDEIIFEILSDDEENTTEIALELSKILNIDIYDYRNREMEIYNSAE